MSTYPQLKPMSAGDILDRAIRIYRHNFLPLVIIVAVVSVPLVLIQVIATALTFPLSGDLSSSPLLDGSTAAGVFGIATVLTGIVGAVFAIFEQGAIAYFVSERFLGKAVTVRQAYRRSFSRWLSLLIAALLLGLALSGLFLVLFGVIVLPLVGVTALGANGGGTASTLAGLASLCLCLLFIPALLASVFLYTHWVFWIPSIVLESYNSTGGLGRSWKLVRGTFWRVLGFIVVLSIIITFFSAGPIYLVSLLAIFLPSPILGILIQSVASSIIVILVTPIQYATLTVLYYDLRIRKEGFDLQMQLNEPFAPPANTLSLLPDNPT